MTLLNATGLLPHSCFNAPLLPLFLFLTFIPVHHLVWGNPFSAESDKSENLTSSFAQQIQRLNRATLHQQPPVVPERPPIFTPGAKQSEARRKQWEQVGAVYLICHVKVC